MYIDEHYTLLPVTSTQSTQYVRHSFTLSEFKMKRFHRKMSKKWSRLRVYSLGRILLKLRTCAWNLSYSEVKMTLVGVEERML